MATRRELKDSLIDFLLQQRDHCRLQTLEGAIVERREPRWDRRGISDRRSNIFPNKTEFSRRVRLKDRRKSQIDRRNIF